MNNSTKTNSNKSSLAIFLILVFPLSFFYTFLTGAPFLGVLTGNFFVMLSLYSLVQVCDSNYSKYILLIFVIKYALVVYQAINKDLPMGGVDWIHYHNNAKAMIENSGNILEALSVPSYRKIVSVDYRHNKTGKSINDYVMENNIDYVVFVPGQSTNAYSLKQLELHLGQ